MRGSIRFADVSGLGDVRRSASEVSGQIRALNDAHQCGEGSVAARCFIGVGFHALTSIHFRLLHGISAELSTSVNLRNDLRKDTLRSAQGTKRPVPLAVFRTTDTEIAVAISTG